MSAIMMKSKTKSWKLIRDITIPDAQYLDKTVDGVTYSSGRGVSHADDIISIGFSTTSDGVELKGKDISAFNIKVNCNQNTNINQGFVILNDSDGITKEVAYISGFKNFNRTYEKYIHTSREQGYYAGNGNPYKYPSNWVYLHDVSGVIISGFELTSILGEGTRFEIWAYGYWD